MGQLRALGKAASKPFKVAQAAINNFTLTKPFPALRYVPRRLWLLYCGPGSWDNYKEELRRSDAELQAWSSCCLFVFGSTILAGFLALSQEMQQPWDFTEILSTKATAQSPPPGSHGGTNTDYAAAEGLVAFEE
ncbi:hypothetical protein BTVI_89335 [Pitangus sulphuratus]|nr:hypothetical protein BTVI_89335 [Pitangus sulphuratus]